MNTDYVMKYSNNLIKDRPFNFREGGKMFIRFAFVCIYQSQGIICGQEEKNYSPSPFNQVKWTVP